MSDSQQKRFSPENVILGRESGFYFIYASGLRPFSQKPAFSAKRPAMLSYMARNENTIKL